MTNELTAQDYIAELRGEATKIVESADEAATLYANGNPAGAALVLGLLHYKFDAAMAAGGAAMDALKEQDGVTPEDAIKGRFESDDPRG